MKRWLLALLLLPMPVARADSGTDFLGALGTLGISYQDPAATVRRGHLVCDALTTGGFSYTETVYGMGRQSGSTVAAENGFAAVAIGYFCADQEYRVMPAQAQFPADSRVVLDR